MTYDDIQKKESVFDADGVLKLECVASIPKGVVFGELGIIERKLRAATIMCKIGTEVGYMARDDYERVLGEVERARFEKDKRYYGVTVFHNAFTLELAGKIGYMFQKKKFGRNHSVYRQGDVPKMVYILKKGQVLVYKTSKPMEKTGQDSTLKALCRNTEPAKQVSLAYLSEGELFGDDELGPGLLRSYSTVCTTETVLLTLDRDKFVKLMREERCLSDFINSRSQAKKKSRNLFNNEREQTEKFNHSHKKEHIGEVLTEE